MDKVSEVMVLKSVEIMRYKIPYGAIKIAKKPIGTVIGYMALKLMMSNGPSKC